MAADPYERFGAAVQPASQSAVDGGTEASECRAVHVSPKPERRMIPPVPLSMDTGTSPAMGWINLTTLLLRRFASFRRAALRASVTRRATSYGFDPQLVSFWLLAFAGTSGPRRVET